jgi:hypothetical protein
MFLARRSHTPSPGSRWEGAVVDVGLCAESSNPRTTFVGWRIAHTRASGSHARPLPDLRDPHAAVRHPVQHEMKHVTILARLDQEN